MSSEFLHVGTFPDHMALLDEITIFFLIENLKHF